MKIKKIILLGIISLFFIIGCGNIENLPSKKVENFFSKYQNIDNDVLTQLELILDSEKNMDNSQKQEYKELMLKQYQNLSYKITDEKKEDNTATVDTEIEVYDYASAITKAKEYFESHKSEFTKNDKSEIEEYNNYKLKMMKKVTEKTTYNITFNLTKEDDKWTIDDISDDDRKKIHGLY